MTEFFFDRSVAIQFGVPGQLGKLFTELRVVFDIDKTASSEPNKAKITIYNLSKDSRSLIEKPGLVVVLQAGYGGVTETIFTGDIKRPMNRREGPDFLTDIEGGDGETAYQVSMVNQSFSPGVTFPSALDFVAKSLGLPVKTPEGVKNETYGGGLVLSGTSKDALDKLTEKQGLVWSIQDGVIQIIQAKTGTSEEAVVVGADSGLIGSPKKKDDGIEFVSLLNPKIKPERPVLLQSLGFQGFVVPKKVRHKGDSHQGDFFTVVEAEFKK